MTDECLFCRIVRGEIAAKVAYEDDLVVAFHDISPQAPTHLLIVPREHVGSVDEMGSEHGHQLLAMIAAARSLASGASYRLVFNHGEDAGQTVSHVHLHLLAGRKLGWPPG